MVAGLAVPIAAALLIALPRWVIPRLRENLSLRDRIWFGAAGGALVGMGGSLLFEADISWGIVSVGAGLGIHAGGSPSWRTPMPWWAIANVLFAFGFGAGAWLGILLWEA